MLVSWSWLKEYVSLGITPDEFARRLMMAGLNHESTERVGDDFAIDLEVTSNRPDCLGHLGIAREAAVLFGQELKLPKATPKEGATPVSSLTKVTVRCPALCPRYTARVIRGVKIAPSPAWLRNRLATIGIAAINNVVDITNYVLMEAGSPLHAFDFAKLAGPEIVVREPLPGEKIEAIDHKSYELTPGMCVIADRDRPVAIAGVMGGASTEVSSATRDVLIEGAEFDPACIRATARKLGLHSDSSYRFERGLDPNGVEWASRRACELILELAGGELAAGVIDVAVARPARSKITLRLSQLKRILGIEVPQDRVVQILQALGLPAAPLKSGGAIEAVPPSWRRDLEREIDLVEEVARVHGYEAIPEDVRVPMATSARTDEDRVLERVRHVMTAAGFDEALTISVVEEEWSLAFSPWTEAEPLVCQTPVLRRADRLRRSLVPSLLGARRTNESLANPTIELFEIAKVYLPRAGQLPDEQQMLGLTSGGGFHEVKGILEALVATLDPQAALEVRPVKLPLLSRRAAELHLGGELLGYLGEVSPAGLKEFDLRGGSTVAELRVAGLLKIARLVPKYVPVSEFPAIVRDMNFVVAEAVTWGELERVVRAAAGEHLESVALRGEAYRNAEQIGAGRKSLVATVTLRAADGTLTGTQADAITERVVAACRKELNAELRA